MNISLYLARRYLFSKKSTNAINLISMVSMVGIAVISAALIIVLSVFNGFEGLVSSLYNSFYPQITITSAEGKFFEPTEELIGKITRFDEIQHISGSLEENAHFQYGGKDYIGSLKGVDSLYTRVTNIDSFIIYGDYLLERDDYQFAVLGAGIDAVLKTNIKAPFEKLSVSVPKRGKSTSSLAHNQFTRKTIIPGGVFALQQEFDMKYVLVPIDFARSLLKRDTEVSALEISLTDDTDEKRLKTALCDALGAQFNVETRGEINKVLFRVMRLEKWAVYAMLTFIVIIISFNIAGSTIMLVIEKKRDISILKAMGGTESLIKKVFLSEALLNALIGSIVGLILGAAICLLQQKFGFIQLQTGANFVISAYPIELKVQDLLLSFSTVVLVCLLAAFLPASYASKTEASLSGE